MTIQISDGPIVTKGIEASLGTTTPTSGIAPPPYVSGSTPNEDAGPNCFWAGSMLKNPLARSPRMGSLAVGGYPNQAFGWLESSVETVDVVPATAATANIASLQTQAVGVPLTLVSITGAGITVLAAALVLKDTGVTIPAGALQIDGAPGYVSYGSSGAMQGWSGAVGRAVSLTSSGNLSAGHFTIVGWDIYGQVMTQRLAGPNATTVNTLKGFKFIKSVTSDTMSATTVSIGTADIFSLPLRAGKFPDLTIWWNNALITAATGFVAAVTTSPATNATGDTRGTYATQDASDGTKRLVIVQRVPAANAGTITGIMGVTQA